MSPTVYFAHGKESGPWGTKITALAKLAEEQGFSVHSPDYQGVDDPQERIFRLLKLRPSGRPLVLVGSSMGGYVSAFAAEKLPVTGLFLMAPALYMPFAGYDGEPQINVPNISVVHGWDDDIVPVENAISFAEKQQADLHVLNDNHMLTRTLPQLEKIFSDFLLQLY